MTSGRGRWLTIAGVGAVTLAADQLTKWWAVSALADGHTIPLVWTLQLALHENKGAAFSMASDTGYVRFLPLLVLVAVAVIVWRTRTTLSRTGGIAVGLIVGGAVGNLMDRALRADGGGLFSGGVVDFIDLQWWPVFNVADMGVVVGGLLFALVAASGTPAGPGAEDPGAGDGSALAADAGDDPAAPGGAERRNRLAEADAPS